MKTPLIMTPATRSRVVAALGRFSDTAARALTMVYVCRVSAIVCVAVFALAFVGQVQEVARIDVLDWTGGAAHLATRAGWHLGVDFVLLLVLGGSTMFWAHYALASRFAPQRAHGPLLRLQRRVLPALLACLPPLGGFIALRGAAQGLDGNAFAWANGLAGVSLAIGPVVVAAFYLLRRWLAIETAESADGNAPPVFTAWYRGALGFGVVLALGCFACVALDALAYGRWLGTIGVLLSACLGVQPVLTWATTSPHLPRWHLLTALVLLGATCSALNLNDNHVLRVEPGQAGVKGFKESFDQWLLHRAASRPGQPVPVILVAAEGGGIRAAYFTAKVLAELQDQCPAFANHLFGISGVSGGSVGAVVFAGLLDGLGPTHAVAAARDCDAPRGAPLSPVVDAVLGEDFIAPLAASLLFTDGVQRLLPFPVRAWDRARTLEDGLERAFDAAVPAPGFLRRSIRDYWLPERALPQLWLQTTSVGSGERVLFSPVIFDDPSFNGLRAVQDDAIRLTAHVSLRSAAVASARFPFVTPAATLPREPPLRLVDGGYFENSGTAMLGEALGVLHQVADAAGIPIAPVLIRIGNTPAAPADPAQGEPAPLQPGAAEPLALGETLSPLRALFSARVARGDLAVRMLRTRVAESNRSARTPELHEFQIGLSRVDIPLGWQISSLARQNMQAQLQPTPGKTCAATNGFENDCTVAAVRSSLMRTLSGAAPATTSAVEAGPRAPVSSVPSRRPGRPAAPADAAQTQVRQPDAPVR